METSDGTTKYLDYPLPILNETKFKIPINKLVPARAALKVQDHHQTVDLIRACSHLTTMTFELFRFKIVS